MGTPSSYGLEQHGLKPRQAVHWNLSPAELVEQAVRRGEGRFFTALSQASDLRQLLAQYRRVGCQAGEQRAYMLAQVLLNYEVVMAGSQCPQIVEACHLIAASSLDEAIEHARRRLGTAARMLYLPHPLQTIPGITPRA